MRDLDELEDRLSAPRPELVADLRRLDGDLVVLGAGGKLGPSLVRLAVRALEAAGTGARVFAVSRYGSPEARAGMAATGAEVVAADVADEDALAVLPDAANVVYLVGAKFGSHGQEAATWATNAYLPGRIAHRYRGSRIVALSTGNVYPLVPVSSGGSTEHSDLGPVGEYAMSCLGRERVLSHVATTTTTPTALIRLNYAVEMRYGVLVDLATQIMNGEVVDVTTGFANVVWQGYANEVTLRSLLHVDVPPFVLNLTGPETISIRSVASRLAHRLGRPVEFTGTEAPTALLSDASRCHGLFGYPDVTLEELIAHTAAWVGGGGPLLGKPTKFQRRDGKF
ncbi:NAD-dependent epimerase/dehydratase family protein [Occultella glacieicola]|uniref:NAD-dependent epimerase/dehydratase family protein n=1 Tax=Occultella glacieicola TaxID=2518684 RepID=A0ABY2E308_9MICO|nr:NmrA family NAD(P)-binding protein [Occultella glacieicola]TDE92793.1 NAD-dependent epimerase/dehydratase family protein [Occultella glacieicola]